MIELQQYLRPLQRWWWLIVLSTGIAAVASFIATKQQPTVYQTSTTMMVGQVTQKTNVSGQDFYITEALAASYAQIAVRQPILSATVDSLGLDISWQTLQSQVYVQPLAQTQLLQIIVSDTNPERATAVADEIARQLILQSPGSPQNKERSERLGFVTSQLDDLETRISNAKARMVDLNAQLDTALSASQIQDLEAEISTLEAFVDGWQQNYTELLNFLDGGDSPNNLSVIEPAQYPYVTGPRVKINVALAAMVGLMLATGAAILLEFIDDTIKSSEELDTYLGLSGLGSVGEISGQNNQDKLITAMDQFSPISEAYRMIRSNIQFMAVDNPAKVILVTSAQPSEGKSTTAVNLAITMAQADLKTIMIDADLRRPNLHKLFGLPNLGGMTDLLRSAEPDIKPYLKPTEVDNLSIITSGPLPPNPSELLGSQRMAQLLQTLKISADVVIVDSPPTLIVSDSLALVNKVDGIILVMRAKRTRRGAIRETVNRLGKVKANILGVVLNGVTGGKTGYGYNYDYKYYTHDALSNKNRPGRAGGFWRRFPRLPFPRLKKSDYA